MIHIKGNNEIEDILRKEIHNKTLSSSLLFVGESYTGKRLAVLSLAESFLQTNPIDSPYFITLGKLPREEEWKIFYQLYLDKNVNFYFLKNFLLYFMKKFNPLIWQQNDNKVKINLEDLNTIQEIISVEKEPSLKEWEKINQIILKIYSLYPKNISIDQIRSLKEWAFSLKGVSKISFIEGAESLSISAMNALLKILEEPPSDFLCVLGTAKRSNLPDTLLSRLRSFSFNPYSKKKAIQNLKEYYQITDNFTSFSNFFNSSSLKEKEKIQSLAKNYYLSLQERNFFPDSLPWKEVFSAKEGNYKNSLEKFLKELLLLWRKEVLDQPKQVYFFQKLSYSLNKEAELAFSLNQNPISFLERLYYQLKKIYITNEDY